MARRRVATGIVLAAGSLAGTIAWRRRSARRRDRVDVYFEDGSMVSLTDGSAEASTVLPLARRRARDRPYLMDDAALLAAIREYAYLEGDFVLRSGKRSSYYLDKYRFETRPELLEEIGARLAARIAEVEPEATLIAGPELGAVALAAAASLASRLPFLIVRGEAKAYGTGEPDRGRLRAAGERVVLVEDVVTSGGAAADAVRAVRQAGLECRTAICVIDREEGGVDALARLGVRLHPLFRAAQISGADSGVPAR